MILLDFSQIAYATIHANCSGSKIELDYLRYLVLNSIRLINKKHKNDFGKLVICCDGKNSWRKQRFPYYKAARADIRKKSKINWDDCHEKLAIIQEEISENFPYILLNVDQCEADDIIAYFCYANYPNGKVLIVSSDKDFQQLQMLPNVQQWSPQTKEFIICEDPKQFLFEQICRGDSVDGIPNILSDDDHFVSDSKRQTPITKKRLLEADKTSEKFLRNKMLIDLTQIPDEIFSLVKQAYNNAPDNGFNNVHKYFVKTNNSNLLQHIQDFGEKK